MGSVKIIQSSNVNEVAKHLQELRDNLETVCGYGYITVTNFIHLSALCGILPAIAYTITGLPKSLSSGSHKCMIKYMDEKNVINEGNKKVFKKYIKKEITYYYSKE